MSSCLGLSLISGLGSFLSSFLGAQAPLEIARVKIIRKQAGAELSQAQLPTRTLLFFDNSF